MSMKYTVRLAFAFAAIACGLLPAELFASQSNCSVTTHTHIRHVHKRNGSIHHHQHQRQRQRHRHQQSSNQ